MCSMGDKDSAGILAIMDGSRDSSDFLVIMVLIIPDPHGMQVNMEMGST